MRMPATPPASLAAQASAAEAWNARRHDPSRPSRPAARARRPGPSARNWTVVLDRMLAVAEMAGDTARRRAQPGWSRALQTPITVRTATDVTNVTAVGGAEAAGTDATPDEDDTTIALRTAAEATDGAPVAGAEVAGAEATPDEDDTKETR